MQMRSNYEPVPRGLSAIGYRADPIGILKVRRRENIHGRNNTNRFKRTNLSRAPGIASRYSRPAAQLSKDQTLNGQSQSVECLIMNLG